MKKVISIFITAFTLPTVLSSEECIGVSQGNASIIAKQTKALRGSEDCSQRVGFSSGKTEMVAFAVRQGDQINHYVAVTDNKGNTFGPSPIDYSPKSMKIVHNVIIVSDTNDSKNYPSLLGLRWFKIESMELKPVEFTKPVSIMFMGQEIGARYQGFDPKFIIEGTPSLIYHGYASCFIDNQYVIREQHIASRALAPFTVVGACALPLSKETYVVSVLGKFPTREQCIGTLTGLAKMYEEKYAGVSYEAEPVKYTAGGGSWDFSYRIDGEGAIYGIFGSCSSVSLIEGTSTGYVYIMDVERAVHKLNLETAQLEKRDIGSFKADTKGKDNTPLVTYEPDENSTQLNKLIFGN